MHPGFRDVFNEKPVSDELVAAEGGDGGAAAVLPRGAVIHTTRGDIWIKLFPEVIARLWHYPIQSNEMMK